MKVSLAWTRNLLDRPIDADEAEAVLTRQGFPIEGVETVETTAGPDTVLDVEVTSNRGDCLSHVGVARELAAGTGRLLRVPDTGDPAECATPVESLVSVAVEDPVRCPVYTARVIRGVKVGPSPEWLVHRLEALGLRSVNNVVDVTNYVLLELGQPLHAFDLGRLAGLRVVIRPSTEGETFAAIDGTNHKLPVGTLVIADAERPQAVAGVMGGSASEVTEATVDVLLESARFDPVSVRRASRALKLASDSSYRFERGVDPLGVGRASWRAAGLIRELAGGELMQGVIRVGEPEPEPLSLSMRAARCEALLGFGLSPQRQAECLDKLGLRPRVEGGGETATVRCEVPTYRLDLRREVDLIEEVARMAGLHDTPMSDTMAIVARPPQPSVEGPRAMARVLIAHGFHETITPSFLAVDDASAFAPEGAEPMVLADERRRADPALRTALLPSLLRCRKINQDVGNHGVKLFETAHAWARRGEGREESSRLALFADAPDGEAALRDLKGTLTELAEALLGDAEALRVEPAASGHYETAATLRIHGQPVGTMGLASKALLDRFDLQTPVVAAELDTVPLLAGYPPARTAGELPRFPAVERDLSIIVDEAKTWAVLLEAIGSAGLADVEAVEFLGTYRGKPIESGKKSVSLRVRFRQADATLTGDAVDAEMAKAVAALTALGAALRG